MDFHKCHDLNSCLEALRYEKENRIASRFPCRVILTHSYESYKQLLESLAYLCDRTIGTDVLFSGADTMPQYDKIPDTLQPGKWVLLPGVSEYLRLFRKSEQRSGRFGKLWHSMVDSSNTARVIIPLYNCEQLWSDHALGFLSDARQEIFICTLDSDTESAEKMDVVVFSAEFEGYISQLKAKNTLFFGLEDWYEQLLDWNDLPRDYSIVTRQYKSVEPTVGDISVRVVKDTFSFVRENLSDGNKLDADSCTSELLDELMEEACKGVSLKTAILSRFNAISFQGSSIMNDWASMSAGKRQLLQMWYRFYPDDTYLCHCFQKCDLDSLEDGILLDIFDSMQNHPEWVEESIALSGSLKLKKSDKFYAKLDSIPVYEDRLMFLSADTREERIYILHMVGLWLRQDPVQVCASGKLKDIYPDLYEYLQRLPDGIESVFSEYILDYKAYKLSNTLPVSEELFARNIEIDFLPFRYALLRQNISASTVILWVDAMGYEYIPMIVNALGRENAGKITSVALAQATLPTETKFNDQWNQMDVPHEKLDKLDKLAHKGVVDEPDYYSCIEEQLSFFAKLSSTVVGLLDKYQKVIITSDHGTSRLAARFFHKREGMLLPKGAVPYSHGRYCSISADDVTFSDALKHAKDDEGNKYLVFSSYDHFKVGGFAAGADDDTAIYGEIHGGASPEEAVVPVIVYERTSVLPLTVQWAKDTVSLKKKKVKAELVFNRPISTLQVKIGSSDADCQTNDGKIWSITLEGVEKGKYSPIVVADGKFVDLDEQLTVKPALGGGEGDLP